MKPLDTIESLEALPVKIDYVGETTRDNNWQCDQWRVTISSRAGFHSFDYFTGLGLRHKPDSCGKRKPRKPKVAQALRKHFSPDTLRTVRELLQDY